MDGSLPRCGSYHPRRRRDAAALGFILLSVIIGITSFLVGWRDYSNGKELYYLIQSTIKIITHNIDCVNTDRVSPN